MDTKNIRIVLAAALVAAAAVASADVAGGYPFPVSENDRGHENIEWQRAYAFHVTDANKDLPRVLLIGDSIVCGYENEVAKILDGRMNVSYWASSYCVTSPNYLKYLALYLEESKFDVVHFNNGLHSLGTDPVPYEKAYEAALRLVREKQPGAKLVWATSTPLKDPGRTAKVKTLNAAAERAAARAGTDAKDDLFALLDPIDRNAGWRDVFHHKPHVIRKTAEQVAKSALAAYGRPKPSPALAKRLTDGPKIIAIVHFGLNTFTDKEWGFGDVSPSLFNPSEFDADRMVGICKEAGIGGIVLVCKHHDGFCLWPTKTTDYNISKTPFWRGTGNGERGTGNGERGTGRDYVKEMSGACRRAGVEFGVYVSPWDRNNLHYGTEKYVEIYHNQIKELLGGAYGKVFEMWFDGANGGDGWYGGSKGKRNIGSADDYYRFPEVFKFVRALQPGVTIFAGESDLSDFRWPGNERGILDPDSRATIVSVGGFANRKYGNPGYRPQINSGSVMGRYFRACESDFPLRRGWFWHASQTNTVKNAAYLAKLYCGTVGNGGTMNIGIAPDRRGRIAPEDVRALKGFGAIRKALFAKKAASGGRFNVVVMKEDIARGEQVDGWEFLADGKRLLSGKSIGACRIRLLQEPAVAKDCRLSILKDGGDLGEVSFTLYDADPELVKMVVSSNADSGETDTAKWMTAAP